MKHTETNGNSQKTFEIGETDLMGKKIVLPPVADYLSTLEKSYGENKTTEEQLESFNKSLVSYKNLIGSEIIFWSEKTGLSYTFWDRLNMALKCYELNEFKWLDFSTNNGRRYRNGFIYGRTYWDRLKSLLRAVYRSFKSTPPHIEQYNKNKNRINWFRNNVWKHFFSYGTEADEASKKLKEMGYNVFPDHVYYDHSPSLRRE